MMTKQKKVFFHFLYFQVKLFKFFNREKRRLDETLMNEAFKNSSGGAFLMYGIVKCTRFHQFPSKLYSH